MDIEYSKYKILIVDDIFTNILLLKVILEQDKFQIVTAQSGKDALELVGRENVDLILLDVMMPGMNGLQVAETLKSSKEYSSIPIIFITALSSSEEIVKGFKAGGSDYIAKPFNKDELTSRVKHQISLIDARRTILQQTEELKSLIESRDRLYSVIAHDLRSPISSLKMVLNALSAKAKEEKLNAEFIEMLDSGEEISEEVYSLLDNLLKWAKAQSGILNPIFQAFNLSEVVKDVADIAIHSARLKDISFDLQLDPYVLVSIDVDMMKSVIRNLIVNAIKFSYPNSVITISLKVEDNQAVVEIKDEGCGISEENKAKLHSKMSSFSTYGTKKEEGTGLGLLLSSHFVDLHQGKFFFDSQEGKGSVFGFTIPVLKSDAI